MERLTDLTNFEHQVFVGNLKENCKNLYEDFFEIYGSLPIDDLLQRQMFNAFLAGAMLAMNSGSTFFKKYTAGEV